VVQIMTDAALLKRQKKEIEELRNKLQVRGQCPPSCLAVDVHPISTRII
jgi:hypothetical protein